jgi:hypothetical protein
MTFRFEISGVHPAESSPRLVYDSSRWSGVSAGTDECEMRPVMSSRENEDLEGSSVSESIGGGGIGSSLRAE